MDGNKKLSPRKKKSIVIAHDGKKISKLVEEKGKGSDKQKIIEILGYSNNSKNAYKRIICEEAPLGIDSLCKLADLLEVAMVELLKDEYKARIVKKIEKKIETVRLINFNNRDDLNKFLYEEEKHYEGRIGIFNSFPSMIYYPDDGQWRCERYHYMAKKSLTNKEYYPIRSLLNFVFSDFYFHNFSKEDKIKVINNFIDAHKRFTNQAYIVADVEGFTCSPFWADCEILGNDYIIITAPYYQNAIFTIKSVGVVEELKPVIDEIKENIIDIHKIIKMLKILLSCIDKEKSIIDFLVELKYKDSTFFKLINTVLSEKLKNEVQERTI